MLVGISVEVPCRLIIQAFYNATHRIYVFVFHGDTNFSNVVMLTHCRHGGIPIGRSRQSSVGQTSSVRGRIVGVFNARSVHHWISCINKMLIINAGSTTFLLKKHTHFANKSIRIGLYTRIIIIYTRIIFLLKRQPYSFERNATRNAGFSPQLGFPLILLCEIRPYSTQI